MIFLYFFLEIVQEIHPQVSVTVKRKMPLKLFQVRSIRMKLQVCLFLTCCGSSICLPILDPSLPVCLDVYSQDNPGFLPHHRLPNFQIPSTSSLESLLLNLSKLDLSSRVHPEKLHFLLFMVCLQN